MGKQQLKKRRAYDREWKRAYKLKHPEKVKQKRRERYYREKQDPKKWEKRKEYMRKYSRTYDKTEKMRKYRREWARKWRKNNLEKARKQARFKYKRNRERIKRQTKAYRQRNKEKIYLVDKKRSQEPQRKLGIKLRIRVYMALKRVGKNKSIPTEKLVGITIPKLKGHIEKQFQKGMTWENYGKWHIDHSLPLASFDLTKPEEQKKAFHYSNLQPLWAKDNLKKHSKIFNLEG